MAFPPLQRMLLSQLKLRGAKTVKVSRVLACRLIMAFPGNIAADLRRFPGDVAQHARRRDVISGGPSHRADKARIMRAFPTGAGPLVRTDNEAMSWARCLAHSNGRPQPRS